jgi:predicted Fe-Mo cluster-binding NifX family protein
LEVYKLKIAVITENNRTISQHFGRAPYYLVLTVENGKIINRETRPKAGHHTFATEESEHAAQGPHGYDAASQARHVVMADPIADCQVLLGGGMGMGAYENLRARGLEVIITDVSDIEQAVRLYLEGKLPNLSQRLH